MKDRKKHQGTKAEIRAYKKRLALIGTAIMVVILVVIIAISIFLIYSYLNPSPNQNTNSTTQLKATIVDHLSLTAPNQTFIQTATNILQTANFTVDYYSGEEVDVEFYRKLPTHGYDLIVLRVHASFTDESVCLFTSERYDYWKYRFPVDEQWLGRVGAVAFSREEAEKGIMYFGIMPSFVQYSMGQAFNDTSIIVMGCDGLMYTPMAEAFIEKGAKVYISWSGPVSASHTDKATIHLLQHLVTEKQTIKQAVENTRDEVGPDPADGSILLYYPDTLVDNYFLPNIATNLILNDATISGYDSESSLHHVHCPKSGIFFP
jgi:hypothetical protein